MWTDAQEEKPSVTESVRRCCFMKPAYQPHCWHVCSSVVSSTLWTDRGWQHPAAGFSQEKCLWIHLQCNFIISAPLQSLDITKGTLNIQLQAGKCCGQAVTNIIACLLFTEYFLWHLSQHWVLPRPLKLVKNSPGGVRWPQHARYLCWVFSDQVFHWKLHSKASGWGS